MPVDSEGRWHPGTEIRTEWEYDISFVLAPDGETLHTKRLTIIDPDPQPGMGPALGDIHQQLRRSDPKMFGHMQYPGELEIIRIKPVERDA